MKAADQVAAFERLQLGAPWAAPHAAAAAAIAAERAAAASEMCPSTISRVSTDALSARVYYSQRTTDAARPASYLAFHERSLTSWSELAGLLRDLDACDEIADAAAQLARPTRDESHTAAGARAGAAAVAAYQTGLARQIVAAVPPHDLAPVARRILAAEALAARLAAAREARESHDRAELVRAEEARSAAATAAEASELDAEIRTELARFEHRDAREDDRRRIALAVTARRRLRQSKVTSLRIVRGQAPFDPQQLSCAVGDFSEDRLTMVIEALDRAEAEEVRS